ncbi:TetR/AcrR family transcriptional regulator [Spongiibacter sp. KMU-158]|uniref:TetR/AcrR family transcriptional regulator n=1 Tax=Spongiibacter pelagi TaxID=2760804 RepID=A0A927C0M7_9GAMM|nr:TetR/AcrR family transcriptional regulator [Spongiibacter pelagi]MBD2857697.1 TetR/AcrR family transcriptional regulator [Spongiibacter pelagi]
MMKTNKRWGSGARVDDLDTGKKMLLQAAVHCFTTKGIKATTIEDIANVANVTRRTVYRYFAGKPDIIATLMKIERTRMFRRLAEEVQQYQDDFPRLLEECIWFTATYHTPQQGNDLVTGGNQQEANPYMDTEESDNEWRKVLHKPLTQYNQRYGKNIDLDNLISTVGRLALAYRQIPTDKANFLAGVRAFRMA